MNNIIEEDIINPDILENIKNLLKSRNKWRKISNITETLGQLFIIAATILAFASGVYKCDDFLAFIAGSINTLSIAILKFSDYAIAESRERAKLLNELLEKSKSNLLLNNERNNTPTNIQYY